LVAKIGVDAAENELSKDSSFIPNYEIECHVAIPAAQERLKATALRVPSSPFPWNAETVLRFHWQALYCQAVARAFEKREGGVYLHHLESLANDPPITKTEIDAAANEPSANWRKRVPQVSHTAGCGPHRRPRPRGRRMHAARLPVEGNRQSRFCAVFVIKAFAAAISFSSCSYTARCTFQVR